MKKRLLSMLLVLTMVLSLVACGSKKEKVKDAKSISDVVEAVQDVKVSGAKVSGSIDDAKFAVECYTSGEDKALFSISYNGKDVTDIIYVDSVAYVNIATLAKFGDELVVEMGSEAQFEAALKQLGIEEKYISITEAEMTEYVEEEMYGSDEEAEAVDAVAADMDKIIDAFVDFVSDFSEPMEFDKDILEFTGSYAELKVNSDNIEDILKEMKNADFKGAFQGLSDAFEKIDFFKNMEGFEPITAEDLEEGESEYLEGIEEMLGDVDSFKEMKPDFEFGFGVKDGNIVLDFTGSYEEDGEKYEASMKIETVSKEKSIKAPESAYEFSKLMEMMESYQ